MHLDAVFYRYDGMSSGCAYRGGGMDSILSHIRAQLATGLIKRVELFDVRRRPLEIIRN